MIASADNDFLKIEIIENQESDLIRYCLVS